MKPVKEYLLGVKSELSKVVWPKAGEVAKLTLIVIIISAVMAAFVGGLDFGFTKLLEVAVTN